MRPVFLLSLALLGITLLLNVMSDLSPKSAAGSFSVIAVSKGRLLPAARLGGAGTETLVEGILAGDLSLHIPYSRRGLRVAAFRPGFRFDWHKNYDLVSSEREVDGFLRDVGRREEGSLIALASFGDIKPQSPECQARVAELEACLGELGAEARPLQVTGASWAMIAVLRPQGWVKLAESYSEETGVSASFVVSSDLTHYDRFQGDLAITRASGPVEVPVDVDLATVDEKSGGVYRNRWAGAGGVVGPSIIMNPKLGEAEGGSLARARWDDVALGAQPGFLSGVGLSTNTASKSGSVAFRLLVDGELVSERKLEGPMPHAWQVFEADLAPYAGQRVSIELQVEKDAPAAGCEPLWGAPKLRYSPGR